MKTNRLLTSSLLLAALSFAVEVSANESSAIATSTPASAASAREAINAPLDFASLETEIEHAYLTGQGDRLVDIAAALDTQLKENPAQPAAWYYRGFAWMADASVGRAKHDQARFVRGLEAASEALEHVKGAPWQAEAQGLESYVIGQLIGAKGGGSAMTLGAKSGRLSEKAETAAPNSPRVLFFRSISLLNTPEMFGGDPVKGAQLIRKAVDLYGKSDSKSELHWGKAETLAWVGTIARKAHKNDEARTAWQKALELEPDYLWVKYTLLPSVAASAQ